MNRTLMILSLLACAATASAWDDLLVLTTDFAAYGAVSVVGRHAPWTATPDVATINADAVARWHGGLAYVVNRGGPSNIQILDPDQGLQTILQFSVGVGRNPQDIVFGPDGHGWVPCYDEAVLLEVDPVTGTVLTSYATSQFADADGLPETSWAFVTGGVLGVMCQRLDRNDWWGPADYSQILLFDPAAGLWIDADPALGGVQGVILAGTNPTAMPEPYGDGRRVRIATAGWYGLLDGGLETVDVIDGVSTGFQVTESQLGGDILDFVTVAVDLGYAIVSDASFQTSLVSYDPRDGTAVTTVTASTGYGFVDVAWDGADQVYLCDRTIGAAGVRTFMATTGLELTSAPVGVGRPPFMVVVPGNPTTSVAEVPRAGLTIGAPWPNPANPMSTIALSAWSRGRIDLEVYDLRGRCLLVDAVQTDVDGHALWTWGGCDGDGRPAPSGSYRVRAVSGGSAVSTSLVLVR